MFGQRLCMWLLSRLSVAHGTNKVSLHGLVPSCLMHPLAKPTSIILYQDVQNKAISESKDKGYESPNPREKIESPPKSMSSGLSEEQQPSADKEDASVNEPATGEQPDDPSDQKQKTLKKPDKILPCPRCKSMDTKFCYYNNYNINQPRHFCKNCQRYWTAGGSMRNVPVGAGRRKNKNSASHYRHIAMSNPSFQAAAVRSSVPDLVPYALKPNGTVLSFASDVPLHESMASSLNLTAKNTKSCTWNGFHHQVEDKAAPACCSTENGDEQSSKPLGGSPNSEGMTTNNSSANSKAAQEFPSAPCFNGTPLMYSWIPAPAALCAPSFPVPFYPAAATYWSCTVPPGTLSVPWVSPPPASSPTKNSPAPGKRSRDADADANGTVKNESGGEHDGQEKYIWMPKTLRIDDPEEAAKSSILAMFGAKNGKVDAVSGGGLFKAFHPVEDVRMRSSQLLHANPAAISRSLNFQESS